jgi:hypothetical protein
MKVGPCPHFQAVSQILKMALTKGPSPFMHLLNQGTA